LHGHNEGSLNDTEEQYKNSREEGKPMEQYGIIGWIVIGGLAGAIAKLLMPGKDPGGCIITILLGIAGALIAGWLGHAVGWYSTGEKAGFVAAIVGAFLLLLIYRLVAGRRA
jgi:uncharacterized membrane protein YeaQ/YmgE (transglycosylase-associated protein family)